DHPVAAAADAAEGGAPGDDRAPQREDLADAHHPGPAPAPGPAAAGQPLHAAKRCPRGGRTARDAQPGRDGAGDGTAGRRRSTRIALIANPAAGRGTAPAAMHAAAARLKSLGHAVTTQTTERPGHATELA